MESGLTFSGYCPHELIAGLIHGRTVAVVTSGFAKERLIPEGELNLATARMVKFKADPVRHTEPEED